MKLFGALETLLLCFYLVNFISSRGIYDNCGCEDCGNCEDCGGCKDYSKKHFFKYYKLILQVLSYLKFYLQFYIY